MIIYMLVIGIIMCVLGILMIVGFLGILIDRYEWFHKAIRKKKISVERERLSKYYSILFFVVGIPLLIGAIIGYANPETYKLFSTWLYVAVAVVGIIGILYCNISNRFLQPLESITEEKL